MFIDSYLRICELMGKSPTTVLKELKISNSVYDNWKKGGEPLNPTKKKIADHFNVTIDELNAGEIKKEPVTNKSDEPNEVVKETLDIFNQLDPDLQHVLLENAKALLRLREQGSDRPR